MSTLILDERAKYVFFCQDTMNIVRFHDLPLSWCCQRGCLLLRSHGWGSNSGKILPPMILHAECRSYFEVILNFLCAIKRRLNMVLIIESYALLFIASLYTGWNIRNYNFRLSAISVWRWDGLKFYHVSKTSCTEFAAYEVD